MTHAEENCRKIMAALFERGVQAGNVISEGLVRKAIDERVGVNEATHQAYLRALISLNFLKLHSEGFEVVKMQSAERDEEMGGGARDGI